MIGLLYKDLCCLKKNLGVFAAVTIGIIALAVMFIISAQVGNVADGVAKMEAEIPGGEEIFYAVFKIAILIILVIPIAFVGMVTECFKEDQKIHFYRYSLTLPLREMQIVGSRYLAMLLFSAVGIGGSVLTAALVSLISKEYQFGSLVCCILMFAAMLLIYMSIVLFLLYCWGASRADLIQCIPFGVMIIAGAIAFDYKMIHLPREAISGFMEKLPDKLIHFMERFGGIFFLAALGVLALSFLGACAVVQKRREHI